MEHMHRPVQPPVRMHLAPRRLAHDAVLRVDHVEEFIPSLGHGPRKGSQPSKSSRVRL
jgi:hypothetical protein